MSEWFREANKAANYVSAGLEHDFPDGMVETVCFSRGRVRHKASSVGGLGPVLLELCEGVSGAVVEYHPQNAYGFVAELKLGNEAKAIADEESQHRVRPRIVVLLTEVKGRPLAVGSRPQARSFLDFE